MKLDINRSNPGSWNGRGLQWELPQQLTTHQPFTMAVNIWIWEGEAPAWNSLETYTMSIMLNTLWVFPAGAPLFKTSVDLNWYKLDLD